MDTSNFDNGLPSLSTSLLNRPHMPIVTSIDSQPAISTPLVQPKGPVVDTASVSFPDIPTTLTSLPRDASTIPYRSLSHHSAHTIDPMSRPTVTVANGATLATETSAAAKSSASGLSKGTKIGIIVSIAVVVILLIIGCGMGIMDCKKRYKRRREEAQNRDSELTVLESEMMTGRAGQKKDPRSGLWDDLKMDAPDRGRNGVSSDGNPQRDDKPEQKALWEGAGEGRGREQGNARKESAGASEREEGEVEWLPVYKPRERVSVVSSAASLTNSATGKPIMPRSFVEGETRR